MKKARAFLPGDKMKRSKKQSKRNKNGKSNEFSKCIWR